MNNKLLLLLAIILFLMLCNAKKSYFSLELKANQQELKDCSMLNKIPCKNNSHCNWKTKEKRCAYVPENQLIPQYIVNNNDNNNKIFSLPVVNQQKLKECSILNKNPCQNNSHCNWKTKERRCVWANQKQGAKQLIQQQIAQQQALKNCSDLNKNSCLKNSHCKWNAGTRKCRWVTSPQQQQQQVIQQVLGTITPQASLKDCTVLNRNPCKANDHCNWKVKEKRCVPISGNASDYTGTEFGYTEQGDEQGQEESPLAVCRNFNGKKNVCLRHSHCKWRVKRKKCRPVDDAAAFNVPGVSSCNQYKKKGCMNKPNCKWLPVKKLCKYSPAITRDFTTKVEEENVPEAFSFKRKNAD